MKQYLIKITAVITDSKIKSEQTEYLFSGTDYELFEHLRSIRNKYYDLGMTINQAGNHDFIVKFPKGTLEYNADEITTIRTRTYYELVLSFLGDHPNSYATENFESPEDAKKYWEKEYKNIPLYIQKITVINEIVLDERTPEQIALLHVHKIDNGWKYLINNVWSKSFSTKNECVNQFIKNKK